VCQLNQSHTSACPLAKQCDWCLPSAADSSSGMRLSMLHLDDIQIHPYLGRVHVHVRFEVGKRAVQAKHIIAAFPLFLGQLGDPSAHQHAGIQA
jgi:hypothetical protein